MLGVRNTTRLLAVAMLAVFIWPVAALAVLPTHSLRAVSFSDANHGYIAGGFNNDGVVSWTSNGGDSWHAMNVTNRFMGGVAASADGGTAVPLQPSNVLYGSSDFGLTWTLETPIHALNVEPLDMAYLSGGRRVVVGNLTNGELVAASSVGGAAFTADLRGPVHVDAEGDPVPTYAELKSVDAVPASSVAWTVGQDRTGSQQYAPWVALIFKTTDGSSWTTQTVPAASNQGLNCVAAVDDQTAYVGENTKAILRTTDGGTTWTRLAYTLTTMPAKVRAIDAYDANKVLIVGDGGKIAWTTNALAATPTWNVNTTATSSSLFGAQMIDANNWIVVGDSETILRTSDAGAHWTANAAGAPAVAITPMPSRASLLASRTISIAGTSHDAGIGVGQVALRFQNKYGRYWNGSTWVTSDSWVEADQKVPSNGWESGWKDSVTFPSTSSFGGAMTITARAIDGTGQRTYASVGKALLWTPKLSTSYVRHTKSFTTSGDLFPKHTAGSTALEFIFQRWEKKSGKYQYVTKTHPSAKAVTTSTSTSTWSHFTVSKTLTAGKWRVIVKHSDSTHGTVYSPYKYFTVH